MRYNPISSGGVKIYRIECRTSSRYTAPDAEELASLVSIMRQLAEFCGITVLTYDIRSGNLSMLGRVPGREQLMQSFEDAAGEPSGSGDTRLLEHLSTRYSESHIRKLADDLAALREREQDVSELLERYTVRFGNAGKFGEGINEAFARWIKKHRTRTYKKFGGDICKKSISLTVIDDWDFLRGIATRMDQDAVKNDQGDEPQRYWCGYSEALRGGEQALHGLRELIGDEAVNVTNTQDLSYGKWLDQTHTVADFPIVEPKAQEGQMVVAPEPFDPVVPKHPAPPLRESNRRKNSAKSSEAQPEAPLRTSPKVSTENMIQEPAAVSVPETMPVVASPRVKGAGVSVLKLAIICIVLAVIGVGATVVAKKILRKEAALSEAARKEAQTAADHTAQKGERARQRKLAVVTRLLQGPEPKKLAEAFSATADPEQRLRMCRFPDKVRLHLASYPAQALSAKPKKLMPMGVSQSGGQSFSWFRAQFDGGDSRILCVLPTLDGLRVDWDCYARHGTVSWPQLMKGVFNKSEVRIKAKPDNYYNFHYKDESKWMCYQLGSPDLEQGIYAYVQRGSAAARVLIDTFRDKGAEQEIMFMLQISSVEGSFKRRQFTLDSVKSIGWLEGEKDADTLVTDGLSLDEME